MAYLITQKGKKRLNSSKKGHSIVYKKKIYKPVELCEILDIKRSTIYRRIEKYLTGSITYKELVSIEKKPSKKIDRRKLKIKTYVVDGKEWTVKEFAEFIGLTVGSARVRLVKYEKGLWTKEQLFKDRDISKINNIKTDKCALLSSEGCEAKKTRKKLDSIPSGGTWEEANLNPTTFYSGGGTGYAKVHI